MTDGYTMVNSYKTTVGYHADSGYKATVRYNMKARYNAMAGYWVAVIYNMNATHSMANDTQSIRHPVMRMHSDRTNARYHRILVPHMRRVAWCHTTQLSEHLHSRGFAATHITAFTCGTCASD